MGLFCPPPSWLSRAVGLGQLLPTSVLFDLHFWGKLLRCGFLHV